MGAGPGSESDLGSDASELVPKAGRQDALHFLHDKVQRSEERAEELQGQRERGQKGTVSAHIATAGPEEPADV